MSDPPERMVVPRGSALAVRVSYLLCWGVVTGRKELRASGRFPLVEPQQRHAGGRSGTQDGGPSRASREH